MANALVRCAISRSCNSSRACPSRTRRSPRAAIGALAIQISAEAQARYDLHRKARRRILADLGAPGKTLNQRLAVWWALDLPALRAEVQKVFKKEIALIEASTKYRYGEV